MGTPSAVPRLSSRVAFLRLLLAAAFFLVAPAANSQAVVSRLAAGLDHTCALTAAGGVQCWGSNAYGQVGDNSATDRLTPVDVAGLSSGIVAIDAGLYHTCALTAGDRVRCWGGNESGQLGDGTVINRHAPVDVVALSERVLAISAGGGSSCAIVAGGGVKCWGSGAFRCSDAGLGPPTCSRSKYTTPETVPGLQGARAIAVWGWYCALTTAGSVNCANGIDLSPEDVPGLSSGVKSVAVGSYHRCALTAAGGIKCWGSSSGGQIGDGSYGYRDSPVDVDGLTSGAIAIATGYAHTCALTAEGGVKCWGQSLYGETATESATVRTVPVDVMGLRSGIAAIEIGSYHTCAVTTGGGARCFGYNLFGQLGDGTTIPRGTPVSVAGLSGLAKANFHGLWWKSPAGAESGWGVSLAHHGEILFAVWFTYDDEGNGMWLVMPTSAKTGEATYSGVLYRTTGPPFDADPWNSARVAAGAVGTATFAFVDADNGTFTYSVGGTTQSKPITRQVFSSPVPTCVAGGTPGATPNYQDLWWRSPPGSESGWGVHITHQGDILFAAWLTYDSSGKGLWMVMPSGARVAPATYSGTLYRTTGPAFNAASWDPERVRIAPVGTATFAFSDASNGLFTYSVGGVAQAKPIVRQVFALPATVCR